VPVLLQSAKLKADAVKLRIDPATPRLFSERATWRYPPPYDFYNDDGLPPKNPERFYSVCTEDGTVAGFFYFEERDESIFYGLGLRPDFTGRGSECLFVNLGLEFARARFGRRRVVLDVAEFNERAIRVYERVGFRRTQSKVRFLEGWGDVRVVDMERAA
jgi:RimJ/RimL family protein N-acetyltransferase